MSFGDGDSLETLIGFPAAETTRTSLLSGSERDSHMIPESQIGKNIKALRLSQQLTLEALAAKAGITKGYLSKVENSDKAPPVSTLLVIAKALGVTMSQLLGEESPAVRCSVVKKSERKLMARNGTIFGYSYETLAHHYFNKKMEPYILTIPAASKESAIFQHEGEEMMLVVEGTMLFYHGGEEYIVDTGDCVYFDSSIPHYGIAADDRDVKCVMVIYVP
jgi:transcriptional regulator with XRE-family HTH domain